MKNENTERRVNIAFIMAMTGITGLTLYLASAQIAEISQNLPPATVAGIVTAIPVMMVSMCGFAAFFAVSMPLAIVAWRERPRRMAEDGYRIQQPQIQQQQIRQLPPPPAQTEPRFAPFRGDIVNQIQREAQRATYAEDEQETPEIAQFTSDYGYQPQYADEPQMPQYAPEPPPIATNQRIVARLGNGDEVTIATAAWLAFAALDKPNRDDWRVSLKASGNSSPNSDYGKCKQIADQYHLLSGAGVWISPKMRDTITQWLTQP